jgi:hypothetical protein
MWANDFGISEKILADAGLTEEEKAAFLDGKLNKIIVSKILKVIDIGSDEVDNLTLGNRVLDFLSENNLQSTYIDGYFKKLSSNSSSDHIDDLKEFKEKLKRLQRLCHLAPRGASTSSGDFGSLQDSEIFLKLWILPHLVLNPM